MLLIPCPWCGERAQVEYRYVGDASRPRPPDLEALPLAQWHDHVYLRPNPRGPHQELWQHVGGCRRFVKVVRDTATHEVLAAGWPDEELRPEPRGVGGGPAPGGARSR